MSVAVYSAFFAVLSFYRLLIETYRQEITTAIVSSISLVILFSIYLYTQARRKAEQVFTGAATTLEGEIAALSNKMHAHKQSLGGEIDTTKQCLLKMQNDFIDAQRWELSSLKAEIATQKGELAALKAEMATQKSVVETQKGELAAVKENVLAHKVETGAQKTTLQGDITKILAWLGRNPYLPNPAVAATTAFAHPRRGYQQVPTITLVRQRDIYEAAMRKQFETAGL